MQPHFRGQIQIRECVFHSEAGKDFCAGAHLRYNLQHCQQCSEQLSNLLKLWLLVLNGPNTLGQALEQDAQESGEITVPGSIRKTYGYGTRGHSLGAGLAVLG